MRVFPTMLMLTIAASAQSTTEFEGRPALLLDNGKLELTVFPQGGAFVRLLIKEDSRRINPIWDPLRDARETGKSQFGQSVGHFVCVDGFGPVSEEERAAGLPGHGEAHTLPWSTRLFERRGKSLTLTQTVHLPALHESLERTVRMDEGESVVRVHSRLENLLAFDRPVNWAEHGTIGSPFLEPGVTVVDMPARRASTRPYLESWRVKHRLRGGMEFTWPQAPAVDGGTVDVRVTPAQLGTGDHTTSLLDPDREWVWVTALNPKQQLVFGYLFRRADFPWVQTWEHFPEDGRLARGLEFSTQPYDVPRREAISTGAMFGAPTFRWLPARSSIEATYFMFYAAAPPGMHRVDEVRWERGELVIEQKEERRQVRLAAARGLE